MSCMEWQGCRSGSGYGMVWRDGKMRNAHREAYEMTHGEIPAGMVVMHSCDNRMCVNPDHLSVGTHKDNMQDAARKGRMPRGSSVNTSKLTEQDVLQIRSLHPEQSYNKLALRFGVTKQAIAAIINNRTWKHVGGYSH